MNFHTVDWSGMTVKVGEAVVILVITWIISGLVKRLLSTYLARVKFLDRRTGDGETLAQALGSISSLLIWLFGLITVLNLFALTQVLGPIRDLLTTVLDAIPRVLGAGLIFFFGIVLARIARELLVTVLQAANVDRYLDRLGSTVSRQVADGLSDDAPAPTAPAHAATPGPSGGVQLSVLLGHLLFAVILLVVSISAVQVLGVSAISVPASHMLSIILDAIPLILSAAVLLALGVFIARFVGDLVESTLRGLGLERGLASVGVTARNASAIVARIVQIAIVLFFAVAATRLLNFPQLTSMINSVLALGGRVVFGGVIIAAGVFLAGLFARTVGGGRTGQIVRWATMILFFAMGLKYMGIADSIINLAFGALVVGGAAAAALAFGLGGRDAAAQQLGRLSAATPAPAPTTPLPTTPPPAAD